MPRSSAELRTALVFLLKLLQSSSQRRHLWVWLRSLQSDYLFSAPSPWITFDAIDYLNSWLHPGCRVFEYGSGGSTLYWLSRDAQCVSVEHDHEWYVSVRARCPLERSFDYRLIQPVPLEDAPQTLLDPSDPSNYLSADSAFLNYSFKAYVTAIDDFPDKHFDVVVIDGRARPSCVVHSITKLKVGGVLVLDNADREYYLAKTRPFLRNFSERKFIGFAPGLSGYTQTNVYEKLGED